MFTENKPPQFGRESRQIAFNRVAELEDLLYKICESWGIEDIRTSEKPLELIRKNPTYKSLTPAAQQNIDSAFDRIRLYLITTVKADYNPPKTNELEQLKSILLRYKKS
jgi:hypothetical protein